MEEIGMQGLDGEGMVGGGAQTRRPSHKEVSRDGMSGYGRFA